MTTDAGVTSPGVKGGSVAARPLDPKELADALERFRVPGVEFGRGPFSADATDLIIAALRAYEPPHEHEWLWIYRPVGFSRPDLKYYGTCTCGAENYAYDLVPVEDAP